ncbi:hypothetical protein C8P63_10219 [Melghirimyces profundicolus]|uniref:Uncharacterized protein n=1 Tax=Melghirimyces profundicolus TaxID=1242148 RepID=A0A2T6C8C2_9BACL|nr:hypothetical protein C8P63_10219 [Melghirimyces profundicolus]
MGEGRSKRIGPFHEPFPAGTGRESMNAFRFTIRQCFGSRSVPAMMMGAVESIR